MDFLTLSIFGNSLGIWLTATIILALILISLLTVRKLIGKSSQIRVDNEVSATKQLVRNLVERTRLFFLVILAVYISSAWLTLPGAVSSILRLLMISSALLQTALWGIRLIDFLLERHLSSDRSSRTSLNIISLIAKIALWSIIVLLILENVTGIQVDTLIASLGITGIAVALAVQNILGDILASLSIALDKPFIIGDSIQVGDFTGSVEHIGLSSTRLRSTTGDQLIFANSDLLESRLRNLTRMQQRQVIFNFNVPYDTPPEKLARIPALIEQIIHQQEQVKFERAHLRELGTFALRYECAFTVENSDLETYLNAQQVIFLALLEKLAQEGVQIAIIMPNSPGSIKS